ncbi:DUF5694 domain-containing protein [Robertkochia flava]|uniref:DUF5694 domain-containing protein n=1 Tax=Robertkochia flava TaxID=3447986 RepID=UPI001CCE0BC7|nr:DUF5694 domain-containing protein [Robertkochia marina]
MKFHAISAVTLIFLLITLYPIISNAQPASQKKEVALLGTFHFAGSNDMVSMNIEGLNSPERQREIEALSVNLAAMKPDKVILEYPYGKSKLDSLYGEYLKGNHQLSINERQQLGFRIAKMLGHEHIYVADHPMDIAFGPLMEYLQESNKTSILDSLVKDAQELMSSWEAVYKKGSVSDLLSEMNTPESDNENKNIYLEVFNRIGGSENNIGVTVVSKWWERNFIIMKNIDLITEPGERALVIFGQGHTAILKDFYGSRKDVKLLDIQEYLR